MSKKDRLSNIGSHVLADERARLFQLGSQALNRGKTRQALEYFKQLTHGGTSPLFQMMGICYRLLGDLRMADDCFQIASDLADDVEQDEAGHWFGEDVEQLGKVYRDWAMVAVARKNYSLAGEQLDKSMSLLSTLPDKTEYFCSQGFLARVVALKDDRNAANWYFSGADKALVGRAPYELNNLVWWLKFAPDHEWRDIARRAWRLAREAKNWRRQIEIFRISWRRRRGQLGA